MTISRVENACKPLILQGLQKNSKIISTQYLTLLIMRVILHIEQRKRNKKGNENFRQLNLPVPGNKVIVHSVYRKGAMIYVNA